MYDRKLFNAFWDNIRQAHGVALRTIDALPADKLDSRPIQNMRTPKELIVHLYGMVVRAMTEGIASGEIKAADEKEIVTRLKTRDDLIRFVNESWTASNKAAAAITDANLNAMVKSPWGDLPGFVCVGIIHDEYFHHRGQVYSYLRQLGGEPPMMWDFEHNATEFQPKAAQTA